ncbi:MAG: DUF4870 domain-containing protein [Planctomycetota bacterium]|nr:DUF4870 domain-containing protein [Planctomycetota bacterium]
MREDFEVVGDPIDDDYYGSPKNSRSRDSRARSQKPRDDYDDEYYDDDYMISDSEANNLAMLCHLLVFVGGIVAPIVIYSMKKDEHPFIEDQAKEVINFQITLIIHSFICMALCFVLIGFLLLPLLVIYSLVLPIIGGLAASRGEYYRYPFIFRFMN